MRASATTSRRPADQCQSARITVASTSRAALAHSTFSHLNELMYHPYANAESVRFRGMKNAGKIAIDSAPAATAPIEVAWKRGVKVRSGARLSESRSASVSRSTVCGRHRLTSRALCFAKTWDAWCDPKTTHRCWRRPRVRSSTVIVRASKSGIRRAATLVLSVCHAPAALRPASAWHTSGAARTRAGRSAARTSDAALQSTAPPLR